MKVMIIGSNDIACNIIQDIISNGYNVILRDMHYENIEKAVISITNNLEKLVKEQNLKEEEKKIILTRLSATTNLKEVVECDLVIDVIEKDLQIKRKLIQELDYICKKKTVIVSNISYLSTTDISLNKNKPRKIIKMEPINSISVIRLIEELSQ